MKKMIALIFCWAVLAGQALAQQAAQPTQPAPAPVVATAVDPKALATAKILVEVTNSSKNLSQLLDAATRQYFDKYTSVNPENKQLVVNLFKSSFMTAINQHMAEMTNITATAYAQNFTAEDMQPIIDFYKSPATQKFVAKSPAVLAQVTITMQPLMNKIVREALENMNAEMRKNNLQIPAETAQ